MVVQKIGIMTTEPHVFYLATTTGIAGALSYWMYKRQKHQQRIQDAAKNDAPFPPVVSGGNFLFGHAIEFGKDPKGFLLDCHRKYGSIFQIRLVFMTYVMSDGSHRKSFFKLPEKSLSFDEALFQGGVSTDATVGRDCVTNAWHVPLIKRSLGPKSMNLYVGRIEKALKRALEAGGVYDIKLGESKVVANIRDVAWDTVAVSSASTFLGEKIVIEHPEIIDVFKAFHEACLQVIQLNNFVPDYLMWLVAGSVKKHKTVMRGIVVPEVERRRAEGAATTTGKYASDDSGDVDMLDVMIQTGRSGTEISDRFMALIFASMITTAGATTNCLNDLAGRQKEREILVEEQKLIQQKDGDGLTYDALEDMPKLHAFIRESIRCAGLPIQSTRIAVKEGLQLSSTYGESEGSAVTLPKGAMVAVSGILAGTQFDNHDEFLPSRFLNDTGDSLLSDPTSIGFFPFGIGRHICPGRHFALAEIKGAISALLREFSIETVSGKVPEYDVQPADVVRIAEPVKFTRIAPMK
mmetsp:Transcript_10200/g.24520  ORF Transcript_10200/g.24520 Transcript_10200/m.24520 type:complete len:521 (-) Transcript_10200:117-1679(-)